MSYKVLTDGNGSGLINVVGLGHFIRLSDHNEVIKECQFAKQELIDLKAERDALAAQVEIMRSALKLAFISVRTCYKQDWAPFKDFTTVEKAIKLAPSQCLAEIRAEAVLQAARETKQPLHVGGIDCVCHIADLIKYAEQIRQGGAK
jgi:hypothetical protein